MSNYNNYNKNKFNSAPYSSKNLNKHGNKPPIEDENIIIIGATLAIGTTFLLFSINLEIIQTHRFSEIKKDHSWKYCGQNNSY